MHATRGLSYVLIALLMTSFPTDLNGKRLNNEEEGELASLELSNIDLHASLCQGPFITFPFTKPLIEQNTLGLLLLALMRFPFLLTAHLRALDTRK